MQERSNLAAPTGKDKFTSCLSSPWLQHATLASKIFLTPRPTKILPVTQEDSQPISQVWTQVKQLRLATVTSKGVQEISKDTQGFYSARPPTVKNRKHWEFPMHGIFFHFHFFPEIHHSELTCKGCVGLIHTTLHSIYLYSTLTLTNLTRTSHAQP